MKIEEFIENFANQFDETDTSVFNASTEFKALDEWSSLTALSLIAMADEAYNIVLNGEDIRNANTIGELFDIVKIKSDDIYRRIRS